MICKGLLELEAELAVMKMENAAMRRYIKALEYCSDDAEVFHRLRDEGVELKELKKEAGIVSIKRVAFEEFAKELAPEAVDGVKSMVVKTAASGLVLFRNNNFDSSGFGCSSVVAIGPTCTYKTVEDCEGAHLHDLPSQRQYPELYCEVK